MEVTAVIQPREDDKEVVRSGKYVGLYFSILYRSDVGCEREVVKDHSKVSGLSN